LPGVYRIMLTAERGVTFLGRSPGFPPPPRGGAGPQLWRSFLGFPVAVGTRHPPTG
jgi:hypothetical protein